MEDHRHCEGCGKVIAADKNVCPECVKDGATRQNHTLREGELESLQKANLNYVYHGLYSDNEVPRIVSSWTPHDGDNDC